MKRIAILFAALAVVACEDTTNKCGKACERGGGRMQAYNSLMGKCECDGRAYGAVTMIRKQTPEPPGE